MFTAESALVQIWARNVKTEKNPDAPYTREQVPDLSNLRDMVYAVLDEEDDEDVTR